MPPAAPVPAPPPTPRPTPIEIHGLDRTRRDTLVELLPREPPAVYTDAELIEFERRIANLGIFDFVRVTRGSDAIDVEVREKWTLIPMFDLSTGTSWADTYAALTITEYNFLGRAATLSGEVWHEARGWNGAINIIEHSLHPSRGSFGVSLDYASTPFYFADSDHAWDRVAGGGGVYWSAPLPHGSYFSYGLGLQYSYDTNVDPARGFKPPNGNTFQVEISARWENMRWDDLASSGIELGAAVSPGFFAGSHDVQPRLGLEQALTYAWAWTETTVLTGRVKSEFTSRGNANFSMLLGSFDGVRGLEDSVYRTWLQAITNVELRQAVRVFDRWALQGVVFADAAAFDRIDARGRRTKPGWGASAGLGIRVIPTFIANVLLRMDVARVVWPDPDFFFQWGLSQYF